jgi:signal peptidase I
MKILALLFMLVALLSLVLAAILGITNMVFPIGKVPAHSFMDFAAVCLLFSIALSLFKK